MISIQMECNCGKTLELGFEWFPSDDQQENAMCSVLESCPDHRAWGVQVTPAGHAAPEPAQ